MDMNQGEILGIAGESGSGKSVCMKSIMGLLPDSARVEAESMVYKGRSLLGIKEKELRKYRGQKMAMIFQDPYSSLNPNWNVREIIEEPLAAAGMPAEKRPQRIQELLKAVSLDAAAMEKFPYEFSGGQRQRIGIARAVAVNPEFIFCDEPISALDVSVQAQVVNMLKDLQEKMGLTYLFTAHDLSMVRHISDRIGVMYLGRLVEIGTSTEVFEHPIHPYTKALISAIPAADPIEGRKSQRIPVEGEIPSPMDVPEGCRFCTRCPFAKDRCTKSQPELREWEAGHFAACRADFCS